MAELEMGQVEEHLPCLCWNLKNARVGNAARHASFFCFMEGWRL